MMGGEHIPDSSLEAKVIFGLLVALIAFTPIAAFLALAIAIAGVLK